jgi:hypothetical protein
MLAVVTSHRNGMSGPAKSIRTVTPSAELVQRRTQFVEDDYGTSLQFVALIHGGYGACGGLVQGRFAVGYFDSFLSGVGGFHHVGDESSRLQIIGRI